MYRREEVVEVKESREMVGVVGEEEIQMRKQYQLRLLNLYEETSRRSSDKWLFTVLSRLPAALSVVN